MPTNFYKPALRFIGRGTNPRIDLDDAAAGAFKILLLGSGYAPNYSTHQFVSDLTPGTNELAVANGYSRLALAGVSWNYNSGTGEVTFNATTPLQWNASGGIIGPARHGIIFYDGASPLDDTERELLIDIDFVTDQSAGDGTPFKINLNASGIFKLAVGS